MSLIAQFDNTNSGPPPPPPGHVELTEEQRARIQRNRELALKRRAEAEERNRQKLGLAATIAFSYQSQQTAPNNNNLIQAAVPSDQHQSQPTSQLQPLPFNRRPLPSALSSRFSSRNSAFSPSTRLGFHSGTRGSLFKSPRQKKQQTIPANDDKDETNTNQSGIKTEVKITLALVNTDRFKIEFTPFVIDVVDKCKLIPSKSYDAEHKIWTFDLRDYELLKQKILELRNQRIEPKLNEIPMGARRLFLNKISPINVDPTEAYAADLAKVDQKLAALLFPYQQKGVSYAIRRGGRLLIADEMGLGKTVQAIAIATAYRNEWPLLIVCPSSVKYMWARQIQRFLNDARPYVIEKSKEQLPCSRSTSVVIIMSYELMNLRKDELKQQNFYVLIFDECHMLKEPKTKRTIVANELAKRANRVLLLSGTPALSRPAELFTQIRMIDPRIFPNYINYAVRYCGGHKGRYGFEAKGQSNMEELKSIIDKIMIRRLKKDVLEDLPDKRREIIYLTGDAINTKLKQLQKARAELERNDRFSIDDRNKKQSFMDYYVLTGQAKMKAVSEHLVDTYFYQDAEPKKILVFAHHHTVLDYISIELAKVGVKFIRIDGSTNSRDRAAYCEQFQTEKKTLVALLSITAAGTGITLTAASVVIFAELYWNPSLLIQAEDRAHRVGQRDSVHVQYMVAKNTADTELWNMIGSKLDVLSSVNLANENYKNSEQSERLCSSGPLITDFFKLLNDENESSLKKLF